MENVKQINFYIIKLRGMFMKKILSILLYFVLLFSMCVVSFFPASALQSDEFILTVTSSKSTITDYSGAGVAVNIPSTLGGRSGYILGVMRIF